MRALRPSLSRPGPGSARSPLSGCRATGRDGRGPAPARAAKQLWCRTTDETVLEKALASGVETFLFDGDGEEAEKERWVADCLERARREDETATTSAGDVRVLFAVSDPGNGLTVVRTSSGENVAEFHALEKPDDTLKLSQSLSRSSPNDTFIVSFSTRGARGGEEDPGDAGIWKIIPAENLIAAKGMTGSKLLPVCKTATEARTMLSVLEAGTDGVVLQTEDASELASLATFLGASQAKERLTEATVESVVFEGLGDRACVDLCAMMAPGEGLLVGSFSRCLFLVHSECEETDYINSRPFRVNAGPVCSYVKMPGDRTAYLSELSSGDEVLVCAPDGTTRRATVGRVKVEHRPLVRVDARLDDTGDAVSVFLQNAETVKVVSPSNSSSGGGGGAWEATPVTDLRPGMRVVCSAQDGARHTGIPVEQQIVEK